MKKKILHSTLLFLFLLMFLFFVNNSFSYLDPDLGWHLKAGQDILVNREVSTENYYNYTLSNVDWVNHEWLADLLSYVIYSNFSYIVLSIFFATLTTLVFYILYRFLLIKYNSLKKKEFISFNFSFFLYVCLSLFGLVAISPHVGVRMQVFALLFFVLLLFILEKYNKDRKPALLIIFPLLFILWANMHGTFILGLALILSFWGLKILERILFYFKVKNISYTYLWNNKNIFLFLLVILSSTFITLINPYGIDLYHFLSGYTNTFYLQHIQEWLPQYMPPINIWQIIYLALGASLIFGILFLGKHKRIKINLWDLFLFVFFLYFSISSKRHFPLFFISSLPSFIYLINYMFVSNNNFFTYSQLRKYINIKYLRNFILFMYFLVIISLISQIKFTNTPYKDYCQRYPCKAVEFIKNNQDIKNKKMFNHYSWGGYLIWQMPAKNLFIDGRMPQIQYREHTILEEYFTFFDKESLDKKLREYNIEMVLMKKSKPRKNLSWFEQKILKLNNHQRDNDLYNYLESHSNWSKVFESDLSLIYIK